MARRKTEEEMAAEVQAAEAANLEAKAAAATNIPDLAKIVLKRFPNLKEAYVDGFGSVYTKDTPMSNIGKAVLYKNPYFNQ